MTTRPKAIIRGIESQPLAQRIDFNEPRNLGSWAAGKLGGAELIRIIFNTRAIGRDIASFQRKLESILRPATYVNRGFQLALE